MLPSGYLQLEYIRATGTQYINTGYSPQSENVIYECEWLEEALNAGSSLFGSTNTGSSSNKWTGVHYHPSAGALYSATGATDGVCSAAGIVAGAKNTLKTTINNGTVTMLRNGTTYTGNYAGSIRNGISIGLFADKRNSDVVEFTNNVRMYSWRMTDNGVLVRDMVPAERVSDGAVGMFDLVEGVFYGNAGSGAFTKGKYVVDESQIVKLEYIQSTGTQYINSEFTPNQDTRVYTECVFPTASSTQALFGSRTSSSANQFQFVTSGNYYRSDYYTAVSNVTNASYGTAKYYVDKAKNVFDLNGDHSLTQTYAAFTCPGPMYIFATNNNGSVYAQASAAIGVFRVYNNGVLARDYYPAKLIANGTIGLWDAVSSTLFTNAGTGTFIEGPEIPTELPAPQNLRATSVTESAITIEWDAVDKATGYKVFRNYVPVSEGTATTYTDYASEPYNGYIYNVAAYNEDMQSVQAEIRVASVGGNPILDLITDRTSEDVDYAKRLAAKGLMAMTDEEKSAFISGLKGAYNAKDLNRVESAVAFLPSFLNGIQDEINRYLALLGVAEDELYRVPYDTPVAELETKTDWAIVDVPRETDFARYLANIAVARNWIDLPSGSPAAPESIQKLTADAANAIEQILFGVFETAIAVKEDKLIYADLAKDAWKYCGTFNCGQEVTF